MNKSLLRILSLVLSVIMILSLAACGSSSTENAAPQATSSSAGSSAAASETAAPAGYAWKSSFIEIDTGSTEILGTIQPILFTDDGFYASAQTVIGRREPEEGEVEQYEGQFNLYGTVLYFVDMEGRAEKLPNYEIPEPLANTEGKKDFYSYTNLGTPILTADGNLMVLEQQGAGWFDGPDSVYGTEEQYMGDYYRNEQSYNILVLDKDGTELSRAPVDLETDAYTWLNIGSVAVDRDGNIVTALEQTLMGIASDGSIAWSFTADDYLNSTLMLPDGTVAATLWGQKGMELCPVDLEAKELGDPYDLPSDAYSFFAGDENYDLYYTSGLYLYGFKLGAEKPEQILNWMTCDINGETVGNGLNISSDGTVSGVTFDYTGDKVDSQFFVLKKVPADSLPQKKILTVAQLEYNPDYQLTNRMVRFNRSHDDIHLEYMDYMELAGNDYSAALNKFNTEIMAGKLPDIIPTGQIPYRQIASKGLLEDLYPYIDNDPELKREDFFPNLISALEVNGGLYQVVSGFSVETLTGAASIVGDTPGWTYDEFYAALDKMPEGCTPLDPYVTRSQVLSALLYADMDSFVDWTTGKVNFEGDNFKQLLEFAKMFPENYDWEKNDIENTRDLVRQGRQMLVQTYLYGLDSLLWNQMDFGGKATYIGWPTFSGVGSIMRFENGFAISKNCSNKDAAWDFIRGMLTESGQSDVYMIPSNRNAFNKKLETIMTPTYRKDADGNYILDENGEKIEVSLGGWVDETGEHNIYAMTQEQADEILEVIETCTKVASYDTDIYDIVNEQAQAYFAGQRSLDEVARLIQSKANIYVNEQR